MEDALAEISDREAMSTPAISFNEEFPFFRKFLLPQVPVWHNEERCISEEVPAPSESVLSWLNDSDAVCYTYQE